MKTLEEIIEYSRTTNEMILRNVENWTPDPISIAELTKKVLAGQTNDIGFLQDAVLPYVYDDEIISRLQTLGAEASHLSIPDYRLLTADMLDASHTTKLQNAIAEKLKDAFMKNIGLK